MDDSDLDETIKRQVEEWSTNSNECFTINLLRGDGSASASFSPDFTYPIFGDEEAIFGYQGLSIDLSFASHNLRPHLSVSYDKKFKAQGDVQATNIHTALREFLPDIAFSKEDVAEALRDPNASEFKPPGILVNKYTGPGGIKYETWAADLTDPQAREILDNMQVLVPMFIEGGTMLQLEQDWTTERWKIFLTYARHAVPASGATTTYSEYSLVGFGTSYRVFAFLDRDKSLSHEFDLSTSSAKETLLDFLPDPTIDMISASSNLARKTDVDSPLKLPSRERLSQFLILPPFHRQNNGQELYNIMYQQLSKDANVREFTVEDPNEAFDELRDFCDMLALRSNNGDFSSLKINTDIPAARLRPNSDIPIDLIVPTALREKLRAQTKIMPRQFDRLVEMQTLSRIPSLNRSRSRITRKEKATNEHDKAYYFWRLYVKQRLYIFNRDQLAQVEREERIDKLEGALDSVLEAYTKMVEKIELKEAQGGVRQAGIAENGSPAVEGAASVTPRVRKRKVVEDDEDEEVDGKEETADDVVVNGHKKVRTE